MHAVSHVWKEECGARALSKEPEQKFNSMLRMEWGVWKEEWSARGQAKNLALSDGCQSDTVFEGTFARRAARENRCWESLRTSKYGPKRT